MRDAKESADVFLLDGAWPHIGGDSGSSALRLSAEQDVTAAAAAASGTWEMEFVDFHVKEMDAPLFQASPVCQPANTPKRFASLVTALSHPVGPGTLLGTCL